MSAVAVADVLTDDETSVLRAISESDYGLGAKDIAETVSPPLTRRRVDTLLDRLSDLGYVVSGWHPPPGAPPTSRASRHWRLSGRGMHEYRR